ncbi:hypothetical protein ACHAPT_009359 [Fusarium lateritium]
MAAEMNTGDDAPREAIHETNLSSIDESDTKSEIPSGESTDDDSTDAEESENDNTDDDLPPLHELLLELREDEQPTGETGRQKLRVMLSDKDTQVNVRDVNGGTPLHLAAQHGLLEAAQALINAGADVSAMDKKERQPLHKACLEGHAELVALLLRKGANIEAKQHHHATPLDEACWKGHIGVVELLLDNKSNTQVTDENGWSPLYSASQYGHEAVVRRLLRQDNSNLNATEKLDGWTALHTAIHNGHAGVVSALLEHRARLDIQDNDGWTPLMTATEQQHPEIMGMLLNPPSRDEDIQLETLDKSGRTPLLSASINGFLDGARQLIGAGANCNARSHDSQSTPLIAASSWRYRDIVEALLNAGDRTNVNAEDKNGCTALHTASFQNHTKVVQLLLEHEASVDHEDEDGQTPLHLASSQGNESVIKSLLGAGASVDATDNDANTALHLASAAREEDQHQLDPYEVGPDNLTPEERCNAEFQPGRHGAVLELLLKNGAKPGAKTNKNETAVHLAAARGDPDRLHPLLKHMKEGDLLIQNNQGQTALDSALKGDGPEAAMRSLLGSDKLKTAEFGLVDVWDDSLEWAAKDSKTHDIAHCLFRKRPRMEVTRPPGSEAWSAIEWAAHEQLPRVLWLLIATSRRTSQIGEAVSSALESVRKFREQPQGLARGQETRDAAKADLSASSRQGRKKKDQEKGSGMGKTDRGVQPTEPRQKGPKGLHSPDMDTIEDILRDPPFAQIHTDSKKYELPRPNRSLGGILKKFEATVVQFYKGDDESGTVRRYRPVQEVIYDAGPTKIMQTALKNLSNSIPKDFRRQRYMIDLKTEPKFTWVHLPSTNVNSALVYTWTGIADLE